MSRYERRKGMQIIIKDGKVYCTTKVPYGPEIIKSMKKAGYKIKEVKEVEK